MSATAESAPARVRPHRAAPAVSASRWLRLGSLPVVAGLLVAVNGLYILLVAFGNTTDFGTNQAFVQHVLSMDTTNFGAKPGTHLDPHVMWRAITTPWIQNTAYVFLIAWEWATGLVLVAAVVQFVRERGAGYRSARALSGIGLLMLLLLFMGGFIAIGGEWFQMWKSTSWNGLDAALRNAALAFLTLLLVYLPSSQWRGNESEL
jgi:predicted small integral membrane protein